ncbi:MULTISPECIES: sulfite exporter TauE/SafE family protein [Sphingobacterium]|uniref:Sulfite exporter TauE/SafE family protein n=1 Tax=Sphingobacterium litopenaei TaxID=2763500 RepID=A0ABR7YI44_9SPHI|nr:MULTISPECIES: sulfite exporter TauE/SafE family protein [Sphingobacterium]MBD1430982.1 sulfite exporter TauE/SafE family protein [Sphingobacterium litopenaei]NGM74568.1 sulfite exporter TauE/SafE family protein [Sphingobacterium sp. SGL-16]
MSYNLLGFFMGLFGSIHCTLMCGPLLFALQQHQQFSFSVALNKILYQVGRILTYGLIGLLFGVLGSSIALKGSQQGFSIFTGVILILIGISYAFMHKFPALAAFQTKTIQPFAKAMGKWLYKPNGSFIAGILNGFLPCGMVYMAVASAMNAETSLLSLQFMVCFGLGTLPLMLLFSLLTTLPKKLFKFKFSSVLPLLYILMGLWFMLRGANLDIPYLSPLLQIDGAISCQ